MARETKKPFNTSTFLATKGPGRGVVHCAERHAFFSQGQPADSVFYLQSGRAKLTVIAKNGKEATVTLLAAGDFFGEESLAGAGTLRTVTATAISPCVAFRMETEYMLRVLHERAAFGADPLDDGGLW